MAQTAKELIDSGIPNVATPTPGYGLILDHKGDVPASALPSILSTWPNEALVPGYEFYYEADAANGIYWHFKYQPSQATYDWVFLGGSPLFAEVTTAETTTSASYTNLTTSGPAVTVPRPGDYLVEIGCRVGNSTASTTTFMSYAIGISTAADADGVQLSIGAATSQSETIHSSHKRVKQGFSGSTTTLTAKYKTNGGTATFADRTMYVTPIRVS